MKKIITIFGSSQPGEEHSEFEAAYKLGALLAKNNFTICTGGFQGIMNAASKGASENGGEAIGVTVNLWSGIASKYLTKEIKCKSLFERILKLVELGDAYIVLQGGTGTLLELAVVWEMMNKGMLNYKPVICHSIMWKKIIEEMNKQMERENRFVKYVEYSDDIDEIVNYIKDRV